ncbi:MAG: carbohydrate ABC transporter permease [Thermomicrobiales bacterium]
MTSETRATGPYSRRPTPVTARSAPADRPRRRSVAPFRVGMVLPTISALLLVVGFPLAYSLYISVHRYDLTEGGIGRFVGAANFRAVLQLDSFRIAATNTVVLTVSVVIIELAVALGLALLLNQDRLRFRNVYLAILLIPLLVSPVAVGLVWKLLLHPDLGAVNWAAGALGLPGQSWLSGRASAMPAVIGVDAWHETSLLLVILLAGLTSLPKDPIEAATVDGAGRAQILRTITLPLLMPVMLVAVLIRMIAAMKTYDLIYILTGGGPGSATETISFRIWKTGFTALDMGRAGAASILLLLVILALTLLLTRVMRLDIEA